MDMAPSNRRARAFGIRGGLCVLILVSTVATAFSCRKPDVDSRYYHFLDAPRPHAMPSGRSDSIFDAEAHEAMPFDSMSLHITCDGDCPRYGVVLSLSGNARFEGSSFTVRPGLWVGNVDFNEFARLCQFIETSGVLRTMPDSSTEQVKDVFGFQLRFWPRGARVPITKTGWEGAGPLDAWLLNKAIEGVASEIVWARPDSMDFHRARTGIGPVPGP